MLRVSPFSGSYEATWQADSLRRFREQVARLYEVLSGEASLRPDYDGSLVLDLNGDGLGHIRVSGVAVPSPAQREHCGDLQLADLDQTQLPALLEALDEFEASPPT